MKELLRSEHVRLLTLSGAGGSGKTRLALRVAEELKEEFPGGTYLVPLASASLKVGEPSRELRAVCWAGPFLGRAGILRLASVFGKPRKTNSFGLTPEQQAELDDLSDNATTQQAAELCAREESMRQVRAAGGLHSVPLVVIVSKTGRHGSTSSGSY